MNIDEQSFLQHLRDLPIEEGRIYLEQNLAEFTDHATIGMLLKDESLRQRDIHPFTALKLAELLIFFGERVEHPPSHALGLQAKGVALSAIGHEQAAMDNFDAAAEEFLRLGDEASWAHTRIGWMISCAWLGRVEEAFRAAARAREIFERLGDLYQVCVTDHNTAVIYNQIGQYQKALEIYDRIMAIYPTLTDQSEDFIKRAMAMVEYNQARNLTWLGEFERASQLFQKAQASFAFFGLTRSIIWVETNLANLEYIQGYYGSALRRYYQARDTIIQNGLSDTTLAYATLLLANCLVKLNRVQEACQLAFEAVAIYRQHEISLQTGMALYEYASTLIAASRLRDAVIVLDEAWILFNKGGLYHHATATKLQQAELLLEMGDCTAAYNQANLLKEYFDTYKLVSRSATVYLIMASALVEHAREIKIGWEKEQQDQLLEEALSLCKQVILLSEQHNLQEQGYKSQYLLGRIAIIKGNFAEAEERYVATIEQVEHILDDLVLDLQPAFLHTTWMIYEDMIALCLQQTRVEQAFSYLERARSLALRQYLGKSKLSGNDTYEQRDNDTSIILRAKNATVLRMQSELKNWQDQYHYYSSQLASLDTSVSPDVDREVIDAELRRSEAKVGELFERLHLHQVETDTVYSRMAIKDGTTKMNEIDVTLLRQQLAPDQLVLAYFLSKGKLVIFAITKEQIITHENPDGKALLERFLPPLYAHLEPRGWPNPQQPPQQAIRRLLQKLYGLLITPVASLLPSPSGSLTIVPYGPLHNLPFHALYNGAHFLIEDFQINYLPATNILTQLTIHKQSANNGQPLILGYSGKRDLHRALDEAKALQKMLNGACYLENEATIARLIEEAQGCPIIHLATHGKCRLDAPNFSYVQLADGQLNAIDAFSLNLDSCQLVTLSGCETGLALSGGGDEQLGLGRAFLAAGASSLVMSLWPVEDGVTNELMQLFYLNLLEGKSKIQALREAQCNLLRRDSTLYSHPYFWAAFHLVGETGPVQFPAIKEI